VDRIQRGTKRTCLSCGVRFYDMNRMPIVCPGCGDEFSAEDFSRPKRARSVGAAVAEAPAVAAKSARPKPEVKDDLDEDLVDEELGDDDADEDLEDEEDDEALIEDTSDLGEDEDDMAEVIENLEGDDETEER